MRGRSPDHESQGPGLSNIRIGQEGGSETATLSVANMPPHSHTAASMATTAVQITGTSSNGKSNNPSDALPAVDGTDSVHNNSASADNPMSAVMASASTDAATTLGNIGGGQALNIRSPVLGITYCVVLQGTFPIRD